jgi:hypothetical protein
MPLNPAPHDRRKLADLEVKTAIVPGSPPHQIFVEARIKILRARVEPAIQSGLKKCVNVSAYPGIQIKREARIEEAFVLVKQSGGALVDVIALQV